MTCLKPACDSDIGQGYEDLFGLEVSRVHVHVIQTKPATLEPIAPVQARHQVLEVHRDSFVNH